MHGNEAPSDWVRRWSHLIAPGSTVLDVACGAGRHLRWLRGLGHSVVGVDRSAEALTACTGLRTLAYEDGFQKNPDRFVQRITAVRELPPPGGPSRHLLPMWAS